MSEKLIKDKKAEKLYYKGNGIIYRFEPQGKVWTLQIKSNKALISLLWKYFYKQTYKSLGEDIVIFRFHDHRFDEIAEFVAQNYKYMEVVK